MPEREREPTAQAADVLRDTRRRVSRAWDEIDKLAEFVRDVRQRRSARRRTLQRPDERS